MPTDNERREVARKLREVNPYRNQSYMIPCNRYTPAAEYLSELAGALGYSPKNDVSRLEFQNRLADLIEPESITGDTSDGYHTFNELYDHRAKLFSVIVRCFKDRAWKSNLHHDGTMYDGMFIVGVETPQGQATYHYDIDPYWDIFDCKELVRAPEWDGHTPEQAISRIASLRPSCDRDTPQKVAEEMFGKMRHSTKEEADAYDAMLKSMSVELHPVDRDVRGDRGFERRKVAARLREAIGLHEFAEVLGFNWTDDSDWVWNDVSNLVADLIDPDCRDESFCKVCGHVIPDGWSECPRCKTKVVSDG